MFSSRLPSRLAANALARRLSRCTSSGRDILDLTLSNPTVAGIAYPPAVHDALAMGERTTYHPEPKGLLPAREAISAYYQETQGLEVSPEDLVLTASTSEAYGHLFKVLADPGDEVLIPAPGYPLFQYLARLEGLVPVSYPSWFLGAWHVDFEALADRITSRTRAILVVNPNNPTGAYLDRRAYDEMVELCARHDLAIVSDEVFTDYPHGPIPGDIVRTVASREEVLCFSLGGVSKTLGLPGLKLSWILVNGPASLKQRALERLEFVSDSFLSVGTPVQEALPALMACRAAVQRAILERLELNRSFLTSLLQPESAVSLVPAQAGWYQVLRVPLVAPEESLAVALLEQERVLVHPGFLFDFPREGHFVASLLVQPDRWRAGVRRLVRRVDVWVRSL